ncbi:MAG: hypothetical protein J5919_06755 [Clostridia bacterium]|nr:hypothetical protein [Clostridia bacterium]
MVNDILKDAALFYKTIEKKKYLITITRKQTTKELTIYFPTENFSHLAGLHYLADIPAVNRRSETVYKEILDGKITYQDIAGSTFIDKIQDRLACFSQMQKILQSDSLYFKSLHGRFKGVEASFVLTTKFASDQFGFLFFAEGNPDYCPCSFFNRDEQREYTKDGTRWTITEFREITKK